MDPVMWILSDAGLFQAYPVNDGADRLEDIMALASNDNDDGSVLLSTTTLFEYAGVKID